MKVLVAHVEPRQVDRRRRECPAVLKTIVVVHREIRAFDVIGLSRIHDDPYGANGLSQGISGRFSSLSDAVPLKGSQLAPNPSSKALFSHGGPDIRDSPSK